MVIVHVDDTFAVGQKRRCDQFCDDFNRHAPINNLGELKWYACYRSARDFEAGTLKISQQFFAENTAAKFGASSGRATPLQTGPKLHEFDEDKPVGIWSFRELVGSLMWPANQTRPDIANAVRGVARYANKPRKIH